MYKPLSATSGVVQLWGFVAYMHRSCSVHKYTASLQFSRTNTVSDAKCINLIRRCQEFVPVLLQITCVFSCTNGGGGGRTTVLEMHTGQALTECLTVGYQHAPYKLNYELKTSIETHTAAAPAVILSSVPVCGPAILSCCANCWRNAGSIGMANCWHGKLLQRVTHPSRLYQHTCTWYLRSTQPIWLPVAPRDGDNIIYDSLTELRCINGNTLSYTRVDMTTSGKTLQICVAIRRNMHLQNLP